MFFLNDEKIEYPKIALDEEIKEALFHAIQKLPTAMEREFECEPMNFLDPANSRGILERQYLVINGEDDIYIGGTDGLNPCMGISLYDSEAKKLVVVHADTVSSVEGLDDVLKEFMGTKQIEVRFFGGLAPGVEVYGDSQASMEKAKNIFLYFYKVATAQRYSFIINIISSDIFFDLVSYRQQFHSDTGDDYIGFAINSRNGKVLVLPIVSNSKEKQKEEENFNLLTAIPYRAKFENCGIYSGVFKFGQVCMKMQKRLGYDIGLLVKQFDGDAGQQAYFYELEGRSLEGLIDLFVEWMKFLHYLSNANSAREEWFRMHLRREMGRYQQEFGFEDAFFYKHLLSFVACKYAEDTDLYKGKLIDNHIYFKDLFVFKLLKSGYLQNECLHSIRLFIAATVAQKRVLLEKRDDAGLSNKPANDLIFSLLKGEQKKIPAEMQENYTNCLAVLNRITADKFLLNQLIEYENSLDSLADEIPENNLIQYLIDSPQLFPRAVDSWSELKVKKLVEKICNMITEDQEGDEISPVLQQYFMQVLNAFSLAEINFDRLMLSSPATTQLIQKIKMVLQANQSSLWNILTGCTLDASEMQDEIIKRKIRKWCRNWVIKKDNNFIDTREEITLLRLVRDITELYPENEKDKGEKQDRQFFFSRNQAEMEKEKLKEEKEKKESESEEQTSSDDEKTSYLSLAMGNTNF